MRTSKPANVTKTKKDKAPWLTFRYASFAKLTFRYASFATTLQACVLNIQCLKVEACKKVQNIPSAAKQVVCLLHDIEFAAKQILVGLLQSKFQ